MLKRASTNMGGSKTQQNPNNSEIVNGNEQQYNLEVYNNQVSKILTGYSSNSTENIEITNDMIANINFMNNDSNKHIFNTAGVEPQFMQYNISDKNSCKYLPIGSDQSSEKDIFWIATNNNPKQKSECNISFIKKKRYLQR